MSISQKEGNLRRAAILGNVAEAKKLIAEGTNVNAADSYGLTSLHLAAVRGHLGVVQLLLESGANVTATDEDGYTALHTAAGNGKLEVAKLLLARGARPDIRNKFGETPLDVAQANGRKEVVAVLERARQAAPAAPSPPTSPPPAAPLPTDVFLTHDWGVKQANHIRVAEINNALKAKGLTTWFDEERMEGNVHKKMQEGIDNTKCVVVFVTRRYMEKVAGDNAGDNCQLEFDYAAREKTKTKMVPVVMEPEVRDPKTWLGLVKFHLGSQLYVDFGESTLSPAKVDELYSSIMSIIKKPLRSTLPSTAERQNNLFTFGASKMP